MAKRNPQEIVLRGFAPDLDPLTPGIFTSSAGVESTAKGWRVQRQLAGWATAPAVGSLDVLTGGQVAPNAGSASFASTLAVHLTGVVGGNDAIWTYAGPGLRRCERPGGYTVGNGNMMFAQFGAYTFATNGTDPVQWRDSTAGASNFADANSVGATGIPNAAILFKWGPPTSPRLMALSYYDGTFGFGQNYDGWWSGPKGSPLLSWAPSPALEVVNGNLTGAGNLTCGISFRDSAVAFSADQMWIGNYDDPPYFVDWTRVADDIGCVGKDAATTANGRLYWVGKQGLFVYDGQYPQRLQVPIQEWLVRWLDANPGYERLTTVTADPATQRLFIGLRTAGWVMQYLLSINLLNNEVSPLTTPASSSGRSNGVLGRKFFYGIVINAGSSIPTVIQEQAVPQANGSITLAPIGSYAEDGVITQVQVRTHDPVNKPPAQLVVTNAFGSDPGSGNDGLSTESKTLGPWRFDVEGAAHWHQIKIDIGTNLNLTADPEVIAISTDYTPRGFS